MSHLQNIVQSLDEQIQRIERLPQGVMAQIEERVLDVPAKQLFFDGIILHCTNQSTAFVLTYQGDDWVLSEHPISVLNRDKGPTERNIRGDVTLRTLHGRETCIRTIAEHWGEQPSEEELAKVVERFRGFEGRLK